MFVVPTNNGLRERECVFQFVMSQFVCVSIFVMSHDYLSFTISSVIIVPTNIGLRDRERERVT